MYVGVAGASERSKGVNGGEMKDEELTSWQVGAQQAAPLPSIGIHEDIFGRPVFLQDQKRNRAGLRPAPTDAKANSTAKSRRDAGATKRGVLHWANIVASWGAALRTGAAGSQVNRAVARFTSSAPTKKNRGPFCGEG